MSKGKRRRIVHEGQETTDGRYVESGAITWKKKMLPLTARVERDEYSSSVIVGTVTDLRRDDDGWVTGVCTFMDHKYANDGDWSMCAELTQMQHYVTDDNERMVVTEGTLGGVFSLPGLGRAAWPEAGEIIDDT